MGKYISCGKFDIKYLYIFFIYSAIVMLLFFTIAMIFMNPKTYDESAYNINLLLFVFLSFFGQSLFIIVEIILNKFIFKNKNKDNDYKKSSNKESSLVIQYIFNDLSDNITFRDTIHIAIISLLYLLVDSTKAVISSLRIIKDEQKLIFNEEYYFLQLLFLYLLSYFIYKTRLYKHQYYSIIIILIIGLIRYLIKIKYQLESFIFLLFQIFITFFESIITLYIKGLMKYKFFSPYKACYFFGIINTILVLIIFFIVSYISCDNFLCNVYHNGKYYFDNIYTIFPNYSLSNKIALFFVSIFLGIIKLITYVIIHNFTVCHLFLFIQNQEFTAGIYSEILKKGNVFFIVLIIISYILEIFTILVFQENIELNFYDLNKNTKQNIQKRANNEAPILNAENNNESSDENDDDAEEEKNNDEEEKNEEIKDNK